MALEEFLGFLVAAVGEEGDAEEVLLAGEVDGILEKLVAEAAMAVVAMDDEVLEEKDEAALCGGDGEEEVDHGEDASILPYYEDAAPAGLLEDEAEAAHVLGAVRLEIALESKEVEEEFRELRKIVKRGRLDGNLIHEKVNMPQGRRGRRENVGFGEGLDGISYLRQWW